LYRRGFPAFPLHPLKIVLPWLSGFAPPDFPEIGKIRSRSYCHISQRTPWLRGVRLRHRYFFCTDDVTSSLCIYQQEIFKKITSAIKYSYKMMPKTGGNSAKKIVSFPSCNPSGNMLYLSWSE
jgi:hypothetical protein